MKRMNNQTRLLHGLKSAKHIVQLFECRHLNSYSNLVDEITLDDGRVIHWKGKQLVEQSLLALDTAISLTKNTFGGK